MLTSKFLELTKDLIRTPDTWVQGKSCVTKEGERVSIFDTNACKFCAVGATGKVAVKNGNFATESFALHFLNAEARKRYKLDIVAVNDDLGFEAVHAVLDAAIAQAKLGEV